MSDFFNAFISYGRADSKAFAARLCDRLTEVGFKIWFDKNDIPLGVDFQQQINDGIEKSDNFIFIIAPHSVNSPYCLKEIKLAIARRKRIIPLLHVEEISYETWQERNPDGTLEQWERDRTAGKHSSFPNMHPTISKINWIYFREELDDFEISLGGLIELFHKREDYVRRHTEILAKALEWQDNQKQHRYLLTGGDRLQAETWLKTRFQNEQPPCLPTDLHCEYICESTQNANDWMSQVFISYSTYDKAIMQKVAKSLMQKGITTWTNKSDIKVGSEFQKEIQKGIERADTILYLISEDAISSQYCQEEIQYATSLNKRILTMLVRPTSLDDIPAEVLAIQFIDLTEHEEEEKYGEGIDKVISQLRTDDAYYNLHKILLVKALKWQEQAQNPSLLLRGYTLEQGKGWLDLGKKRDRYAPLRLHEEYITASSHHPPEESLDVFICYGSEDVDFVRRLNDALQIQGKKTWFDRDSIASETDYSQEMRQGLEQCDNFLFVISPYSVTVDRCREAMDYGEKLGKRFVTISYREVFAKDIPTQLIDIPTVDFKKHGGDFNANFAEFVRILDTDREHVQNHTKWLQRSMEWGNQTENG